MRNTHTPTHMIANARQLRHNQTDEEKKLWYQCLSTLPVRFWRQKIFGNYIVDFCSPKAKLIIELDGSQHYEEENIVKDKQRDEFFTAKGYTVLRYSNRQIHEEFDAVCNDIYNHLTI